MKQLDRRLFRIEKPAPRSEGVPIEGSNLPMSDFVPAAERYRNHQLQMFLSEAPPAFVLGTKPSNEVRHAAPAVLIQLQGVRARSMPQGM
jgi:hypothetical protein